MSIVLFKKAVAAAAYRMYQCQTSLLVTGGHVRVLGGEEGAGGQVEAGAVGVAGGGLLRAAGGHAEA